MDEGSDGYYVGWESESYLVPDSSDSINYRCWSDESDSDGALNCWYDTNKLEEHFNKKSNDALIECFANIKILSSEKQKAVKIVYERRMPKNLPEKLYNYLIKNDLTLMNIFVEQFSIKMRWKKGGIMLLRYKNIKLDLDPISRIISNVIKTRYHDANFFKNFNKHEIAEFSEQDQNNIMWSFYVKNQLATIEKILQENGHLLFQIIAVNNINMRDKINATVNKSANILISSLNINFAYNAFIHCKNYCGKKTLIEEGSTMSKIPTCILCTQKEKGEIKKIKSQSCCIQ